MKILVFGINYAPDLIGVAKYTTEMCAYFRAAGHEVSVVTAPPYYPDWSVPEPYKGHRYKRETLGGISVTRCPLYVPRSPTGVKRLLHHFSFALSSGPAMLYTALRMRPDVVLAIAPSIFAAPGAAFAGMLVGASRWLHLQDLEVDEAFDLGFLSGATFRRTALTLERATLGMFQRLSSISPRMVDALRAKGVSTDRLVEFNNWVDTDVIRPLPGPTPLRNSLSVPQGATVALYSGNMGSKQGLEYLAVAAQKLASTRPDIVFLFCGSGSMRERLQAMTQNLPNVRMIDLQPDNAVNELLSTADIHLLPQMPGVMDLALPSKLPAMLASARPVVAMAMKNTQLYQELDGAGVVVEPGDVDALVGSLVTLADAPEFRKLMGVRGRQLAVARWDRNAVLWRIEALLRSTNASARRSELSRPSANEAVAEAAALATIPPLHDERMIERETRS